MNPKAFIAAENAYNEWDKTLEPCTEATPDVNAALKAGFIAGYLERDKRTDKPDGDGWIEWKGGECPVAADMMVVYKQRAGYHCFNSHAGHLSWRHRNLPEDIIAYKLA